MTTIATHLQNMTIIFRHSDDLREADGAIEWRTVFSRISSRKPQIQIVDDAGMTESLGERKQQEKIPLLRGFRRCNILYSPAIHGHTGSNRVDLSLQDNVEIPYAWIEYINHVGSSLSCNSIVQSGLIAGGQTWKEGRQIVFSTVVDPLSDQQRDELYDVKRPRVVPYQTKWKVYQNSVYWINLQIAQNRG